MVSTETGEQDVRYQQAGDSDVWQFRTCRTALLSSDPEPEQSSTFLSSRTSHISESKKIQFRTGLFNVFNQAYPTLTNVTATNLQGSDIFLALDTVCLRTVANVPNGIGGTVNGNICDPTGGFRFTDGRSGDRSDTLHNFGKIVNLHGRRIVEFALKFEF